MQSKYVFVSYASIDRSRAELVVRALEKFGHSVWWGTRLDAGQRFDEVIETALEHAVCCLVLWSRDSVLSNWVRAEAERALHRKVLVAALLDPVDIPLPFNLIHTVSLVSWSGSLKSPQFRALSKSIEAIRESVSTSLRTTPGHTEAVPALAAREALERPNKLQPFPVGREQEPVLFLEHVLGEGGERKVQLVRESGRIVFHAVGNTGNVFGPGDQSIVIERMISDFDDPESSSRPSFFFHLGDIVYSFGESERYYDQFYYP